MQRLKKLFFHLKHASSLCEPSHLFHDVLIYFAESKSSLKQKKKDQKCLGPKKVSLFDGRARNFLNTLMNYFYNNGDCLIGFGLAARPSLYPRQAWHQSSVTTFNSTIPGLLPTITNHLAVLLVLNG
jgi:hypothetical protein